MTKSKTHSIGSQIFLWIQHGSVSRIINLAHIVDIYFTSGLDVDDIQALSDRVDFPDEIQSMNNPHLVILISDGKVVHLTGKVAYDIYKDIEDQLFTGG